MKNKKNWILTVVLLTICIGALWAATPPDTSFQFIDNKESLRGIKAVSVIVENVWPEIERLGLTGQQLKTDVELRLRQNGIKVLSIQENVLVTGAPTLYLNVNFKIDYPTAAYAMELELKQLALLMRDPTKMCQASTWETGSAGTVGLANITSVRETVRDTLDKFINDYLAVNPKN